MKLRTKRFFRCVICNKTSNSEIETNCGEVSTGHFHDDIKFNNGYICDECQQEINDTLVGYGDD